MRVNPRIVYIYVPVYVATGGIDPKRRKKIEDLLAQAISGEKDPDKLKKLKDIQAVMAAVLSKMSQIPGGMKDVIMGMLEDMAGMVADGNIEGALSLSAVVSRTAEESVSVGAQLKGFLNRARSLAASFGNSPAGTAMMKVLAKAEEGLANATSVADLAGVVALLAKAVELGEKIAATPKNSKEYPKLVAELDALGGWGGKPKQKAFAEDELSLSFGAGRDVLQGMIDKATDPFTVKKLSKLQGLLHDIQAKAEQLPAGFKDETIKRLNQLISMAANGDVDGALVGAQGLLEFVERAQKLMSLVAVKGERLEGLRENLRAPGQRDMIDRVLDAANGAAEGARSPEDAMAIDRLMGKAIELTLRLQSLPPNDLQATAILHQLAKIEKELKGMAPEGTTFEDTLHLGGKPAGPGGPGGPGGVPSPGAPGDEVDLSRIADLIDTMDIPPPPSPGAHEPHPPVAAQPPVPAAPRELTPEELAELDKLSRANDPPAADTAELERLSRMHDTPAAK